MSSRGSLGPNSRTADRIRSAISSADCDTAAPMMSASRVLAEEIVGRAVRLGRAVGVEHHDVAGPELHVLVLELHGIREPEERAPALDRLHHASGPAHDRQRMAAARQQDLGTGFRSPHQAAAHGAKAVGRRLVLLQRLVQRAQHLLRTPRVQCGRSQRVTCEPRDRRRFGPFAGDVADRDAPTLAARLEDVVEIAADFVALTGRDVTRGDPNSRDARKRRRQQARLERRARRDRARSTAARCRAPAPRGARTPPPARGRRPCSAVRSPTTRASSRRECGRAP